MGAAGGVTVVAAKLVGQGIVGACDVFYSNFEVVCSSVTPEFAGTKQHEGSSAAPRLQD